MNIIDSNSQCGYQNSKEDNPIHESLLSGSEDTQAEAIESIDDKAVDENLLDTLAQISDTIYDDLAKNEKIISIEAQRLERQKAVTTKDLKALEPIKEQIPHSLPKKKPTISHVKLQILSKQKQEFNLSSYTETADVSTFIDKLAKVTRGETKNARLNKTVKLVTSYSLPVVMFLAGSFTLVHLYNNYQSEIIATGAVEVYSKGNLSNAQKELARAIQLNPENPKANYYLGLLLEGKDKEAAYKHIKVAAEAEPANNLFSKKALDLALVLNQYNHACGYLDNLIGDKKDKLDTGLLSKRALVMKKLGSFDKALSDYQKVLEFEPTNEEAIVGTAFCCINKNEVKAAQFLLKNLLETNPQNVEARLLLGWCHKNEGNYKEAYSNLNWVAQNAPQNVKGQLYLAQLLDQTGKLEESKQVLASVLKLEPDNYQANQLKATHLLNEESYAEALTQLVKLESHPQKEENYKSLSLMSKAALKANDKNRALLALTKIIALDNNNAQAYLDRAKVYASQKSYKKAIGDAGNAIKADSKLASAYVARAKYHNLAGNLISSKNDYHKALSLDPNSIDANLAIAKNHAQSGNHASAMEHFSKVLDLESKNQVALAGVTAAKKTLKQMVGKGSFSKRAKLSKQEIQSLANLPADKLVIKGYEAMKSGRYDLARLAYTKALTLEPGSIETRRYLAHTYLAMGNPKEAEKHLLSLARLGASKASDNLKVARAYLQNNMMANAILALERQLETNPYDLEALELLANTYTNTGHTERAIDLCNLKLKYAKTPGQKAKIAKLLASLNNTLKNDQIMENTNYERSAVPVDVRG